MQRKKDKGVKDPFLEDYIRILYSNAHRRLGAKAQVFSLPRNTNVANRLFHTNEVLAIATEISERLGLNTHLCMAIAAGHDIGHAPHGHVGELTLSNMSSKEFRHEVFGVVLLQHIENRGRGLNLTYEVLEGILNHARGEGKLVTRSDLPPEASVVMYADKIAYTCADYSDAIRYGYLSRDAIPECAVALGNGCKQKRKAAIDAVVSESLHAGRVQFHKSETFKNFEKLRKFMYTNVYNVIDEELQESIVKKTYDYFANHGEFTEVDPVVAVALLTDNEVSEYGDLLLHYKKPSLDMIRHWGVFDCLDFLRGSEIDYANPDLEWRDDAFKV